jgi:class 3 adenylate cyclase
VLEAYLGRRSAGQVQAGAIRRGSGETIRAALLFADLRGFTLDDACVSAQGA